jgi:hypothetical protein
MAEQLPRRGKNPPPVGQGSGLPMFEDANAAPKNPLRAASVSLR